MRAVKRNLESTKADKLVKSMMDKSFWGSVKKMNQRKSSLPEKIGSSAILDQWRCHFKNSEENIYHSAKVNTKGVSNLKFSLAELIIAC